MRHDAAAYAAMPNGNTSMTQMEQRMLVTSSPTTPTKPGYVSAYQAGRSPLTGLTKAQQHPPKSPATPPPASATKATGRYSSRTPVGNSNKCYGQTPGARTTVHVMVTDDQALPIDSLAHERRILHTIMGTCESSFVVNNSPRVTAYSTSPTTSLPIPAPPTGEGVTGVTAAAVAAALRSSGVLSAGALMAMAASSASTSRTATAEIDLAGLDGAILALDELLHPMKRRAMLSTYAASVMPGGADKIQLAPGTGHVQRLVKLGISRSLAQRKLALRTQAMRPAAGTMADSFDVEGDASEGRVALALAKPIAARRSSAVRRSMRTCTARATGYPVPGHYTSVNSYAGMQRFSAPVDPAVQTLTIIPEAARFVEQLSTSPLDSERAVPLSSEITGADASGKGSVASCSGLASVPVLPQAIPGVQTERMGAASVVKAQKQFVSVRHQARKAVRSTMRGMRSWLSCFTLAHCVSEDDVAAGALPGPIRSRHVEAEVPLGSVGVIFGPQMAEYNETGTDPQNDASAPRQDRRSSSVTGSEIMSPPTSSALSSSSSPTSATLDPSNIALHARRTTFEEAITKNSSSASPAVDTLGESSLRLSTTRLTVAQLEGLPLTEMLQRLQDVVFAPLPSLTPGTHEHQLPAVSRRGVPGLPSRGTRVRSTSFASPISGGVLKRRSSGGGAAVMRIPKSQAAAGSASSVAGSSTSARPKHTIDGKSFPLPSWLTMSPRLTGYVPPWKRATPFAGLGLTATVPTAQASDGSTLTSPRSVAGASVWRRGGSSIAKPSSLTSPRGGKLQHTSPNSLRSSIVAVSVVREESSPCTAVFDAHLAAPSTTLTSVSFALHSAAKPPQAESIEQISLTSPPALYSELNIASLLHGSPPAVPAHFSTFSLPLMAGQPGAGVAGAAEGKVNEGGQVAAVYAVAAADTFAAQQHMAHNAVVQRDSVPFMMHQQLGGADEDAKGRTSPFHNGSQTSQGTNGGNQIQTTINSIARRMLGAKSVPQSTLALPSDLSAPEEARAAASASARTPCTSSASPQCISQVKFHSGAAVPVTALSSAVLQPSPGSNCVSQSQTLPMLLALAVETASPARVLSPSSPGSALRDVGAMRLCSTRLMAALDPLSLAANVNWSPAGLARYEAALGDVEAILAQSEHSEDCSRERNVVA